MVCNICNVDLEKVYGQIAKEFIHVHHKYFISQYDQSHEINPIDDLIPVCPNCHAMLHRKINNNYLTVEELRILIDMNNSRLLTTAST